MNNNKDDYEFIGFIKGMILMGTILTLLNIIIKLI